MKPKFILCYAGAGVKFCGTTVEIVDELHATRFATEADAWWHAYRADLNPDKCSVQNLSGGGTHTSERTDSQPVAALAAGKFFSAN